MINNKFTQFLDLELKNIKDSSAKESYKHKLMKFLCNVSSRLKQKNITDEDFICNIAIDLLQEQKLNYLKFQTPKSKTIIRAELWDKIQYIFTKYYDRMIHVVLHFNKTLNADILTNVLVGILEKTPILRSRYKSLFFKSFWIKNSKYKVDDFFKVVNTSNLENDLNNFITSQIPINGIQIQVRLFNSNNKSTLAILINHMCFDGTDAKYLCYKICDNYNFMLKGHKTVHIRTGSRKQQNIYADFNEEDKKLAKHLYKNVSLTKTKTTFPWTKATKQDKCEILLHKINKENYEKLKALAKTYRTTLNDALLTVLIQSLYDVCKIKPTDPLAVQVMVNLRRHLNDKGKALGLTNHTGFATCQIPHKCDDIKDTFAEVIKTMNLLKKDKFIGLYGIPLLNLSHKLFPDKISSLLIKIGYRNPLFSISNIGLIETSKLMFGDAKVIDGYMTGAIKYKPYMQLAFATFDNVIILTVASKCNEQDKKTINHFFKVIDNNLASLLK